MIAEVRIVGYDHVKIGDHFKVPRQVTYKVNDDVLCRVLAGLSSPLEVDVYIRLPDGDKLLDNSQRNN